MALDAREDIILDCRNFAEPMVTKAFMETKSDFRAPIATPAKCAAPGYYPTEYRMYWNAVTKEYRVALAGLVDGD